jgi:Flp pilus assembly protein TadG
MVQGLRRRDSGQDMVEYAIVLPLLLMLVLGIMEFAVIIYSYNALSNAAREGARYGIIHPTEFVAINQLVKQRAMVLDENALLVDSRLVGNAIEVEATYDLSLMTGALVEALGGNSTLRLHTVTTMYVE